MRDHQLTLLDVAPTGTSTFGKNMALPVHRWFRYSAGFSAEWAESVVRERKEASQDFVVLDPFVGSGTTLLAADSAGVASYGAESHPFVCRIANAKLCRTSDVDAFRNFASRVLASAKRRKRSESEYPDLIRRCFTDESLDALDRLRVTLLEADDGSQSYRLTWLVLVSILRSTSHVGTAQWQYVLPRRSKRKVADPFVAFANCIEMFATDMAATSHVASMSNLLEVDARTCAGVPTDAVDLVVTSPPYPNNYDYADATRLEMMFMREIDGWSDLQDTVRSYLIRSCSQHTTKKNTDVEELLADDDVEPIRAELISIVDQLSEVRKTKGGKKNYHLMVAAYFSDLAKVWHALRRTCKDGAAACFVVGDSAPYGVYLPVDKWLGELALSAGFTSWTFEKIRDRNTKWKNRKHRVPLCEGRLWVEG